MFSVIRWAMVLCWLFFRKLNNIMCVRVCGEAGSISRRVAIHVSSAVIIHITSAAYDRRNFDRGPSYNRQKSGGGLSGLLLRPFSCHRPLGIWYVIPIAEFTHIFLFARSSSGWRFVSISVPLLFSLFWFCCVDTKPPPRTRTSGLLFPPFLNPPNLKPPTFRFTRKILRTPHKYVSISWDLCKEFHSRVILLLFLLKFAWFWQC